MSDPTQNVELARREGSESTTIEMTMTSAGDLIVSGHDLGPTVRRTWGSSDYEYRIQVAAIDMPRLAAALIAEHYRGDFQAVIKLRDLAERHKIAANFWSG